MAPKRKGKQTNRKTTTTSSSSSSTSTAAAASSSAPPEPPAPSPPNLLLREKSLIIHAHIPQYPQSIIPTSHHIFTYGPPDPLSATLPNLTPITRYPVSEHTRFRHLELIGSPNGVVCVFENPPPKFTLWNPFTQSTQPIPSPFRLNGFSVGLAFDPSLDDYKIVRIIRQEPDRSKPDEAEVYSLKSGRGWRTIRPGDNGVVFWAIKRKCDAVVKGVPYWNVETVVNDGPAPAPAPGMLSFDAGRDAFEVTLYSWEMENMEICIGEISEGRVGAVVWEKGTECSTNQVLGVWRKGDQGQGSGGWSEVCRVDKLPAVGRVLGFYGDRRVVIESGVEGTVIVMFNLESRVNEDVVNIENTLEGSFRVVRYRETLTVIPQIVRP